MKHGPIIYEGTLCQPWLPGKPTRAKAYVPAFHDVLDFDSYRLMGHIPAVRAHVTYPDHYALLLAILNVITEESNGGIQEILINSRMPSVVRVPQDFFGRNVLFLNAPRLEAERIAVEGTNVLVIEERFLRHTVEDADNSLKLAWFNAPSGGDVTLLRMSERFATLGIQAAKRNAA